MGGERNSSHSKSLDEISRDTWRYLKVKPREILTISKEQDLLYRGNRSLQPDLVFHTKRGVIIVEYKSTEELSLVEKGRDQLKKAMTFYETFFGVPTRGFLIAGDRVLEHGDLSHFKKNYNNEKKQNTFNKKPFYLNSRKNHL
jgi:hypothetical protein